MKKQQNKAKIVTMSAMVLFGLGLILSVFGLSATMSDIGKPKVAQKSEVVLARAGVEDGGSIGLPVTYFDQKADKCVNLYDMHASKALATRQFEWTDCGYNRRGIEQGLVDYKLNEEYLPVTKGGKLGSNLGVDMKRWFTAVEGQNKEYNGTINLNYKLTDVVEFSYVDNDFYPLDEVDFSKSDKVNVIDGHNHLFTMSFAVPFTVAADGSESFEIVADDDTFVFIGDELAVDMGGIHDATVGKIAIMDNGEVYTAEGGGDLAYNGMRLSTGDNSVVRIFHADRDSANSVFRVKMKGMNLNVMQTQLAEDKDGVQVAYDPTNPSYVEPLGETETSMPDVTRGHMITATILGILVVVCSMFMAMLMHTMIKSRK